MVLRRRQRRDKLRELLQMIATVYSAPTSCMAPESVPKMGVSR